MSDLVRGLVLKKQQQQQQQQQQQHPPIRSLRPGPSPIAEDDGDSSSSASSVSSVGTIVPSQDASAAASEAQAVPWYDYFAQELFLHDGQSSFHVYITPPQSIDKDPLYLCHHGAGSGGLSFALLAREIRGRLPRAGVLAIEARDHGSSVGPAQNTFPDFSLDAMSTDLESMVRLVKEKLAWPRLPPVILVGHSLGGAVVCHVAQKAVLGSHLLGFAVIDVVEGSALDAIKSMRTVLNERPSSFGTVDAAVDWHIRSRTLRNSESAHISVPPLLHRTSNSRCFWRTDLAKTQPFWQDWFKDMSSKFLAGKAAKLLLLAGTDRLDKTLMIGQMQGKFQLHVYPEAGHFVHEDVPEKTADALVDFYKRNDRSALVLPPKVSDLIAQGKKV